MENKDEITDALRKALSSAHKGIGSVTAICGESGIGKTYLINSFLEQDMDSAVLLKMKGLPTDQSALSSIYEALYYAVSGTHVAKAAYVYLLRKYTRLLPGFGKFIAPLLEDVHREAFGEVVARSGIGFDAALGPNIIRFIQEISKNRRVFWICDDIQWIDPESWETIATICDSARQNGWAIVLLYNERTESWCDAHTRIHWLFEDWGRHADDLGWTKFEARRWSEKTILNLCIELLEGPCEFTTNQVQLLRSFTSGIPLYLKSALQVLREAGSIKYSKDRWVASGSWKELDIHADLRSGILQRLKRIYLTLPKSRDSLEVASVIGESFQEEIINAVLNTKDTYDVFCQVENQFRVIEYLFEQRHWTFDHNVTREAIYRSLGKHASKLHLTVAKYLDASLELDASPLTVAYHYEQGGDIQSACRIKIEEVERLLERALFESALRLLETIASAAGQPQNKFDPVLIEHIRMLWGRLLFHTSRYHESMEHFGLLCQKSNSVETRAIANRWMGKALIKLASPQDFSLGIEHLSQAREYYETIGNTKFLGDVLTDLVVAHAHMNSFKEAEALFAKAEACYNRANDHLGMARLQRRNVIFMQSELSAPILERVASTFEDFGVVHEMVMSLNNAATEYLYIEKYDKATKLLQKAIEESLNIGGFHIGYMYNNLALIDIINKKFDAAGEKLHQARENSVRTVVNVVLENNEAVVQAETLGPEYAQHSFRRVLETAKSIGERAYLIPATTNLAVCLVKLRKEDEAIRHLLEITPQRDNSYSAYKNKRWFNLLRKLYKDGGCEDDVRKLEQNYHWCRDAHDNSYYNYEFSLIDLQFWSD